MAAARFSLSPVIITPNHYSTKLEVRSKRSFVVMCADNDDSYRFSVDLQIRSPFMKTKVFEDRIAGIVCYRDENGEITCEGDDEGPRLHPQFSRSFGFNPTSSSEVGIIEILERCWLQAVADGKDELKNNNNNAADNN